MFNWWWKSLNLILIPLLAFLNAFHQVRFWSQLWLCQLNDYHESIKSVSWRLTSLLGVWMVMKQSLLCVTMIIYSYLSYIVTKIYNFHRYTSWKQHALGRSRYLQQVAVVLILLLSTGGAGINKIWEFLVDAWKEFLIKCIWKGFFSDLFNLWTLSTVSLLSKCQFSSLIKMWLSFLSVKNEADNTIQTHILIVCLCMCVVCVCV